MINNKPRGISFNKNALNIQPLTKQLTNLTTGVSADNENNLDTLKSAALSSENPQALGQLQNPIKKLQIDFNKFPQITKFKTTITDENAQQRPFESDLANLNKLKVPQQSQLDTITSRIPKLLLKVPAPLSSRSNNSHLQRNDIEKQPAKVSSGNLAIMAEDEDVMMIDESMEEIEDIDKSDTRDAITLVSDVAKDIYEYMYLLESEQSIRQDYLKDQKIYTPKIRQRLINWCIETHRTLKLLPETLYMTIMVIDRYFDMVTVKQQSTVQLVACGAILIASKYEEIYPPYAGDLIHLTQNSYSRRELFKMEIHILEQLNYQLGRPIPLAFLRRFSAAAHSDVRMHAISKYFMELSLTEYECSYWKPSLLAAAALFTTIHLVHNHPSSSLSGGSITRKIATPQNRDRWNKTLVHYTHYTRKELQQPAAVLCKILKKSQKNPQSYTCVRFNAPNLPKWPELKSIRVDELIKLGDQM